jgi:hypothetical protein
MKEVCSGDVEVEVAGGGPLNEFRQFVVVEQVPPGVNGLVGGEAGLLTLFEGGRWVVLWGMIVWADGATGEDAGGGECNEDEGVELHSSVLRTTV